MPSGRPKKLDSAKQDAKSRPSSPSVAHAAPRPNIRASPAPASAISPAEIVSSPTASNAPRCSAKPPRFKHIYNAERGSGTAAWLLERTFPDDYARKRPKSFSYDEARVIVQHVSDTLAQYITDREARQEAYDRLTSILDRNRRNACAASDPYPRPATAANLPATMNQSKNPINPLTRPTNPYSRSPITPTTMMHSPTGASNVQSNVESVLSDA